MPLRTRIAVAGLVAATLPVVIATSGHAETSPSVTTSTPSASATTARPSSTSAATSTSAVRVEKPIALRMEGKVVDPATLPNAGEVFTKNELAPLVRGLTAVSADDDTLDLTITGEPSDDRSRLVIDLPHTGAVKDVESAWKRDKALHEKRAHANPGLYTFFGAGAHGVDDSFTDGTTTYALVRTGDAAAVIRFSGIGFTNLADSHAESRRDYTKRIVPALVDLLGAKTHAGQQSQKKSASSAPTSQSAAPSSSSTS